MNIYERARREVNIPRKDGRRQKYAANRYKQQIDRAHADDQLVPVIGRIVSRRTEGFGHLEDAGRDDLMVEMLVLAGASRITGSSPKRPSEWLASGWPSTGLVTRSSRSDLSYPDLLGVNELHGGQYRSLVQVTGPLRVV